ncbi:hypothetical protein [Anaerosolibacter sp.]|uniref:hypothetical protein n=1 Tax=Anaerosolibacter sp. TaxID=1872527 RepID=UPI0039F0E038
MLNKEQIEAILFDVQKTIKERQNEGCQEGECERLRGMEDMLKVVLEQDGMVYIID